MNFTIEEKSDMLEIFYSCRRNSNLASQIYSEQFLERRQPHYTYFLKLDRIFKEFGSVVRPNRRMQNHNNNENLRQDIIEEVGI